MCGCVCSAGLWRHSSRENRPATGPQLAHNWPITGPPEAHHRRTIGPVKRAPEMDTSTKGRVIFCPLLAASPCLWAAICQFVCVPKRNELMFSLEHQFSSVGEKKGRQKGSQMNILTLPLRVPNLQFIINNPNRPAAFLLPLRPPSACRRRPKASQCLAASC